MTQIISQFQPELTNHKPYYFLSGIIVGGLMIGYFADIPFVIIFLVYGLIPYLDQKASKDWKNPTLKQVKQLEDLTTFKIVLYVTVILQWITYYFMHNLIWNMGIIKGIALVILGITVFGVGFMLSHELVHKSLFDKVIGTLDQIKSFYGHFTIEHVYGHHKRVATPQDPASAEKGITVYQFLPKSIIGSYKSSFEINPTLTSLFTVSYFVFLAVIYKAFEFRGLILALILGFGAVFMLEVINYVQHYGLRRKRLQDGTYEKVTIRHSWNAPHRMSNYLLFKLQRHSDHHQNAMKPYQTLCSYEDSPTLPHGYVVCIILALFPKTWFDIMDPLVDEYYKNNEQKGAQLKQLKIAQQKTLKFVKKVMKTTATVAIIEITFKLLGFATQLVGY